MQRKDHIYKNNFCFLDSSVFTEVKISSVSVWNHFIPLWELLCAHYFCLMTTYSQGAGQSLSANFTINLFLGFPSFPCIAFPNVPQYVLKTGPPDKENSVTVFAAFENRFLGECSVPGIEKRSFPQEEKSFRAPSKPRCDISTALSAYVSPDCFDEHSNASAWVSSTKQPKLSLPAPGSSSFVRNVTLDDSSTAHQILWLRSVWKRTIRLCAFFFKRLWALFFKTTSILPSLCWSKLFFFKDLRFVINTEKL